MTTGDKATCAICGAAIDYLGSAWRHTGGQRVGHPAAPVENDQLRPADVIRMPLAEFERRFKFRPTDALEKKWYAITAKRLSKRDRAEFDSGTLGGLGDLDGVNMED